MKAKATYAVKKWEENTLQQISPDMKMTKASVEYEFTGDLEGKAVLEGSGTASLKGIKGTGSYRADKEGYRFEMDYEL